VSAPRVYAPHATDSGATIELPQEEAAHLTRVLRLSAGARVRVFNGSGREWEATIDRTEKDAVAVTLEAQVAPASEPRIAIALAVAVLKGDKMDAVVRDAVMLGIVAIRPVITTRTEVSAAAILRSHRIARWQRIAVSSAKQSGRAVVPKIFDASDLATALDTPDTRVMLVEPSADVASRSLADVPAPAAATLLVGPEGGWTPAELREADASGAILMTLGRTTLRADSVPLIALTALRVRWGDF
jgi:16S rRNA (uracil1498-N3)-methyltransferase